MDENLMQELGVDSAMARHGVESTSKTRDG